MPLLFASLITIIVAVLLFWLDMKSRFGELPYICKQIVFGIAFGLVAIFATELGSFELNGAAVNVRDAAPITAGLIFGPWAGIISGLIGAFDRFFIATPIFGIGVYTQISCSIATVFAGCIAALFKVTIFKKHNPMVLHAFVFVLVTEVVHMCLVPLTHLDDLAYATLVMYNCFIPLLIANSLNILFVFMAISYLNQHFKGISLKEMFHGRDLFFDRDLFYSFRFWLLTILIVAFGSITVFVAVSHEANSLITAENRYKVELESIVSLTKNDAQRYATTNEKMAIEYCDDWSSDGIAVYSLFDKNDNLLSKKHDDSHIATTTHKHDPLTIYHEKLSGTNYYIMYTNLDDYRIVLYMSEEYAMFVPHLISMITTFFLILIFGALMLVVFLLLRKMVGQNLEEINESLERLSEGDFDETVNVHTSNEFSQLSDKINKTVGTLKQHIEVEANKYNEEFATAHDIQLSALPSSFPAFPEHPEIDVYAKYRAAREVGGDFYDYYHIDKNTICFIVADVSGKGVPAAMFMMRAKLALMMFATSLKDPASTLRETNNYLCVNNMAEMFVTCWIGFLDIKTGKLTYASAGHNPPMLARYSNSNSELPKVEELKAPVSLVLAGYENIQYKNAETTLSKNDVLLLFTDGVTEANNPNGELYGEARLSRLLATSCKNNAQTICESALDDVDSFVDKAEQFDDITILAVKLQ